MRNLSKGSTGQQVKILQSLLNMHGANLEVDGSFGKLTVNAVKAFQKSHNLECDGLVGTNTWNALGVLKNYN